jgi:Ca2+-binding RTX toxin-like protein
VIEFQENSMSTTNITGTEIGPINVNSANDTYNIKAGATLVVGGDLSGSGNIYGAILENGHAPGVSHDNVFNIDGRVIGLAVGTYTVGDRDKITVGETGEILGAYGIAFSGDKVHVTNNGEIISGGYGGGGSAGAGIASIHATNAQIVNNGSVSGAIGIAHDGANGMIVNGKDGFITGTEAGIHVGFGLVMASESDHPAAGPITQKVQVVNHGLVLVNGDGLAFVAENVNVTLTNDGTLDGNVVLGDGNSVFDNRGGTVDGSIIGGLGDDVLIVDAAKYKLIEAENEGNDTVKSTVSYHLSAWVENLVLIGNKNIDGTGTGGDDHLTGNVGDNTLTGKAGADFLAGGKGNDKLSGGGDNDEFHFATGDGHDKFMDFHAMESDKIDFSSWDAVDSLAKVKAHAQDQGSDVLITAGDDSVLIVGMHKADLTQGLFDFAN